MDSILPPRNTGYGPYTSPRREKLTLKGGSRAPLGAKTTQRARWSHDQLLAGLVGKPVEVNTAVGVSMCGLLERFDKYALVVRTVDQVKVLIYKHAIVMLNERPQSDWDEALAAHQAESAE